MRNEAERLVGKGVYDQLMYLARSCAEDRNQLKEIWIHPFVYHCLLKYMDNMRFTEIRGQTSDLVIRFHSNPTKVNVIEKWQGVDPAEYLFQSEMGSQNLGRFRNHEEINRLEPNHQRAEEKRTKSRAENFCDDLEKL